MAAIVPQNMEDAYRLAQLVHQSGLQPKDMDTPQKVMVAILHGLEVGLKPMQAVQKIAVINGRPAVWGDAALGLVRASGLCAWVEEWIDGEGDDRTAYCKTLRVGEPKALESKYSVKDAKVAKLWEKKGYNGKDTPWITSPDRMLQMRARGFRLRDSYADVLGGMYLAEELQGEAIDAAIPTPPTPPAITSPPVPMNVGNPNGPLPAHIAEGPNRSERGEFADANGVEIPLGALSDFDAFHRALESCPSLTALNAMYETLIKTMQAPDDLTEAAERYNEVAAKFERPA